MYHTTSFSDVNNCGNTIDFFFFEEEFLRQHRKECKASYWSCWSYCAQIIKRFRGVFTYMYVHV